MKRNTATTATASENSTRITKWAKRYLGVAKRMKNDEVAICVEYIDRTNIVIEFPAYGNYRVRTTTKAFNDGKVIIDETIEKPRLPKKERLKYERLGMEKVMHNGAKAKCIAYRSASDCDFELSFPGGKKVIVTDKQWHNFISGQISSNSQRAKKTRIGETRQMNCGMNATITAYKNAYSMTVTFENGIVKEGVAYHNFKAGKVAYSSVEAKKRNGKIRKANFAAKREGNIFDIDGKRYILLDYVSSRRCVFLDIDTDKTINRSFFWASTGGTMNAHNPLIANKAGRKRHRRSTFDHLGEIYYLKNGLLAEIIDVCDDIRDGYHIRFSDTVEKVGVPLSSLKKASVWQPFAKNAHAKGTAFLDLSLKWVHENHANMIKVGYVGNILRHAKKAGRAPVMVLIQQNEKGGNE